MADMDDNSEFDNLAICICSSRSEVIDSHVAVLKGLLPEHFHHLLCSYEDLDGSAVCDLNSSETMENGNTDSCNNDVNCIAGEGQTAGAANVTTDSTYSVSNAAPTGNLLFRAKLRVNVENMEELELWQKEYAERSKTTMRFANVSVCTGRKTLYKTRMRCQHNTLPRSTSADKRKSSKNTCCPAVMNLTLKRWEVLRKSKEREVRRASRSQDIHMPDYPLVVSIEFTHNHALDSANVLRRRDVAPHISTKFRSLMGIGHGPLAALNLHKYDLYLEHGPHDYMTYVSDRHHCPDSSWCYRQYYKLLKKKCRGLNIAEINIDELREQVDECTADLRASLKSSLIVPDGESTENNVADHSVTEVNAPPAAAAASATDAILTDLFPSNPSSEDASLRSVSYTETFVAMDIVDGKDFAVAICTPLMKRVHRLVQQSCEVVFVTVGPPADKRRQCRVAMLVARSCAGGLPLGILAATSDPAIKRAAELYVTMLDSRCFFGRGSLGPQLFVVDDWLWTPLRDALTATFKASSVLLSGLDLMLGFWRHLWDRKSAVPVTDRGQSFHLFRSAICSSTVDRLHAKFTEVRTTASIVSCSVMLSHVTSAYERRTEWSVCCQPQEWISSVFVSGLGGTRGLCDRAARVLKDVVVHRVKSMPTLATLLDFAGSRVDRFYERRLMDVVCDRLSDAAALRFMHEYDSTDQVVMVSATQFDVVCSSSSTQLDPALSQDPNSLAVSQDVSSCQDDYSVLLSAASLIVTNGSLPLQGNPNLSEAVDTKPAGGLTGSTSAVSQKLSVFRVDFNLGFCSCDAGCSGAPCHHQWAVHRRTESSVWSFGPVPNLSAKRLLAHVATGLGFTERAWFAASHPLQFDAGDELEPDSDSDAEGLMDGIVFNGACIGAEETVDAIAHLAAAAQLSAVTTVTTAAPAGSMQLIADPPPGEGADRKRVFINWNGMSYELSLPQVETAATSVVVEPPLVESMPVAPPPSRDRLRQAFSKIEEAYAAHSAAMESSVSAFCQNVETIDTLETLNTALLCFGMNSYVSSTTVGTLPYSSWS